MASDVGTVPPASIVSVLYKEAVRSHFGQSSCTIHSWAPEGASSRGKMPHSSPLLCGFVLKSVYLFSGLHVSPVVGAGEDIVVGRRRLLCPSRLLGNTHLLTWVLPAGSFVVFCVRSELYLPFCSLVLQCLVFEVNPAVVWCYSVQREPCLLCRSLM